MSVACMISAILGLAMPASSCDQAAPEPVDVQFLSSDAYFLIGEERFVLPFVAIRWVSRPGASWNDAFQEKATSLDRRHRLMSDLAGDPSDPMPAANVEIAIEAYENHGEQGASTEICPRLDRQWARDLCRGTRRGIVAGLPRAFELFDRRFLSQFKNKWASEQETVADRIAKIEPLPVGRVGFSCEAGDCIAAVAVSASVLAIWRMHAAGGATVPQTAERQGAAIFAFAKYAIGEHENIGRLDAPDRPRN